MHGFEIPSLNLVLLYPSFFPSFWTLHLCGLVVNQPRVDVYVHPGRTARFARFCTVLRYKMLLVPSVYEYTPWFPEHPKP